MGLVFYFYNDNFTPSLRLDSIKTRRAEHVVLISLWWIDVTVRLARHKSPQAGGCNDAQNEPLSTLNLFMSSARAHSTFTVRLVLIEIDAGKFVSVAGTLSLGSVSIAD